MQKNKHTRQYKQMQYLKNAKVYLLNLGDWMQTVWMLTCMNWWHRVTCGLVGMSRNTSSISAVLLQRSRASDWPVMIQRPTRSSTTLPSDIRQSQIRSTVWQQQQQRLQQQLLLLLLLRLRSHRHDYESESGFPFTGCLSLVQASSARVERSRSLLQAHNSTRVCWQSPVKSNPVNALRKK